jgi:hypothetical protein
MDKVVMTFDLKNNEVNLHSGSTNSDGAPLFEWNLNSETGEIMEATRQADSKSERIIERQVTPESLHNSEVQEAIARIELAKETQAAAGETLASVAANSTQASSASSVPIDWDSLDMQRDLAFKIVYFFIVFIVATFGLLYAYFQMNKKEVEDEQARLSIKHQVRNKDFAQANNDHTFFDFLAGGIDEEAYQGNPYANVKSAKDSGFGSGNLESLGE